MKLSTFSNKATKMIFVATKSIGGIKAGKTYRVVSSWSQDGVAMVELQNASGSVTATGRNVISAMFEM
jgi:hypothetical protein